MKKIIGILAGIAALIVVGGMILREPENTGQAVGNAFSSALSVMDALATFGAALVHSL